MLVNSVLALLAASASAAPVMDKRGLLVLPPDADEFYYKPSDLASYKPGDIISSRSVNLNPQLFFVAQSAEQVVYKTSDIDGGDSWTVATIITPHNPQADPKLFSYQFWEDSTELNCSPSYSLQVGLLAPDGVTAVIDTPIIIEWALTNGYHVVVADHEGPDSAFFAGAVEGYAGLDGIRAAINRLHIPQDTPVGLFGYSGGAHASVWMSALHETYAPELNIVGAAHGGTPVDAKATVEYLDGKFFSGFVLGALTGLMNAYPQQAEKIIPLAKPSLRKDVGVQRADSFCILNEVVAFGNRMYHTEFTEDFYSIPGVVEILNRETLLNGSSAPNISTPTFPRYLYHATSDDIIPFEPLQEYVNQQCAEGANIQLVPFDKDDHVTIEIIGIPGGLQFIQQAFEGKLPQIECGKKPDDVLTIFSDGVASVIGQPIADALKALEGVVTPFGKIIFSGV